MENNQTTLKLIAAHNEAGNVKTFSFETGGLNWTPGQHQTYTLPSAGTEEQENTRFFTIASAPSEQRIDISTRISDSSFKQTLNSLSVGDTIQVHGLEGDFTWDQDTKEPITLIAAGIGVTPYRSMLLEREANNLPLNATLIYFNRNEEIPFLDIFQKIEQGHEEFTLINITGEHVNAERILELAPQIKTGTTYISGPEPMVDTIGEDLKKLGVNLKQDWFPGYTSENF